MGGAINSEQRKVLCRGGIEDIIMIILGVVLVVLVMEREQLATIARL